MIGRTGLRSANLPVNSDIAPVSEGTRSATALVASVDAVPTLPTAVVTLSRTLPNPRSLGVAELAGPVPAVVPPGRSAGVPAGESVRRR